MEQLPLKSKMKTCVFTDLDETLFRSKNRHEHHNQDVLAARDKHGTPICYQSQKQVALLQLMNKADRLIPVTGRSVSAFQRVCLPFVHEAIVHHGAVILTDQGQPEVEYTKRIHDELSSSSQILAGEWIEVQRIIEMSSAPLRTYRQTLNGSTIEICVKHIDASQRSLGQHGMNIYESWRNLGDEVRIHWNGNNLALLPGRVDKLRAVRWLRTRLEDRFGPFLSVAAGDSSTDYPFMSACDFYIVPSGSQIDSQVMRSGESHAGR